MGSLRDCALACPRVREQPLTRRYERSPEPATPTATWRWWSPPVAGTGGGRLRRRRPELLPPVPLLLDQPPAAPARTPACRIWLVSIRTADQKVGPFLSARSHRAWRRAPLRRCAEPSSVTSRTLVPVLRGAECSGAQGRAGRGLGGPPAAGPSSWPRPWSKIDSLMAARVFATGGLYAGVHRPGRRRRGGGTEAAADAGRTRQSLDERNAEFAQLQSATSHVLPR